jgi:hypothetical protein
MMLNLLNDTTKYTLGQEAILAYFSGKGKDGTHLNSGDNNDEAIMANRHRDKKCSG